MKGIRMLRRTARRTRANDGQIIVIFALGLVAMIAMVGLVLDGGSTYAQRRSQQNASDLAALAGANEFMLSGDKTASALVAQTIATKNGYVHDPTANTTVAVSFVGNDARVQVDISAPHRNNFTGVVGITEWQVSTTATVETGPPDTTSKAAPFIFNEGIFTPLTGEPLSQYSDPDNPFTFGDGNGDVPNNPGDIAWTCYGTCGSVDSDTVREMIDGTNPVSVTLDPTDDLSPYIGQENQGEHAALYKEVNDLLAGDEVGVPIVDDNGLFQGWAMFHVTSASIGAKTLTGYFVSPYNQVDDLHVTGCSGTCPKPRYFGVYVLRLVN